MEPMTQPGFLGAAFLVFVLAVFLAQPAAAQTPGSSETSTDQTLAQDLASAPPLGHTGVSVTIGGQIQQGRTETKGLTVNGIVAHTTHRHELLRVDAETGYARYRPKAGADDLVVENNQQAAFTYLRPVHKQRVFLFGSAGWRRDAILGLDYRAFAEAGAGAAVIAHAKVNAFLGASYAVGREHRNHTDTGNEVLDVGLLQNIHIRISNVMGIEEWFKGHLQTTHSDDRNYTFNVALLTKVTKHAGLKIYYKRQYDALTPPTVSNLQTEVGLGLQIDFKPVTTAKP